MDASIIVAIITVVGSIVSTIIANKKLQEKTINNLSSKLESNTKDITHNSELTNTKIDQLHIIVQGQLKMLDYRIDALEQKVMKHNNFMERIHQLEVTAKEHEDKLDWLSK